MLGHGNAGLQLPFRTQWSPPCPPADIVVQVGSHPFQAHRSVLAAHSDYFERILADYAAANPTNLPELLFLTLPIPSVTSKLFAVLLDFMYSSRLRLDTQSVADVLFGAQLLRMRRAIDACHGHLLQLQQRLFGYQALGLYPAPILPDRMPALPLPLPHHSGIVRPIPTAGTPAYFSHCPSYLQHPFGSGFPAWPSMAAPAASRTFDGDGEKCRSPVVTPFAAPLETTNDRERESPATLSGSGSEPDIAAEAGSSEQVDHGSQQAMPTTSSVQAVVDIACCDGPVKFQRVLNENCSLVITMTATAPAPELSRSRERTTSESTATDIGMQKKASLYRCVHCEHSFKSRCCYMKHRWRHLNPISLEGQLGHRGSGGREVPEPSARVSSTSGSGRKPLEINVPFYPCKVCGCKFPSYYFVHKHRRMCHQKRRPMRKEGGEDSSSSDSSGAISDPGEGDVTTTDNGDHGGEDSASVQ